MLLGLVSVFQVIQSGPSVEKFRSRIAYHGLEWRGALGKPRCAFSVDERGAMD